MNGFDQDWLNGQSSTSPDWEIVKLWFPRLGMLVTRHGVNLRLLTPGRYERRRSRTIGRTVYRQLKQE